LRRIGGGATREQCLHDVGSPYQRCAAECRTVEAKRVIGRIRVGSMVQQRSHDGEIAAQRGLEQRRPAG